jgi:hypothetical protein
MVLKFEGIGRGQMAERSRTLESFFARQVVPTQTQAPTTIPRSPVSEDSTDDSSEDPGFLHGRAANAAQIPAAVAGSKPQKKPMVEIPVGWTLVADLKGPHRQYRCPHLSLMGNAELGRCTKIYRRSRITQNSRPVYARYNIEQDGPIPFDASFRDELLGNLGLLCGRLNISARAEASEAMRGFIDKVVRLAFQFAEAHPHIAHSDREIFQSISAHSLGNYIISASDSERIAIIEQYAEKRFASLALDAWSIVHLHFVNFVIFRAIWNRCYSDLL